MTDSEKLGLILSKLETLETIANGVLSVSAEVSDVRALLLGITDEHRTRLRRLERHAGFDTEPSPAPDHEHSNGNGASQ